MAGLFRNFKMNFINKRFIATSRVTNRHFKLIIAGGGTGGSSTAHRFGFLFNDKVAIIEPSDLHFYQPLWTLVGGGIKKFEESYRPMSDVLPKSVQWIKEYIIGFDPDKNSVTLKNGEKLTYDFLIVALGIQLRYDLIPGAVEALEKDDRVVSNYSKDTVHKTFKAFNSFSGGNALFSFPNTPVKCAGAPQKVMYLFDQFVVQKKLKNETNIHYFTTLPTVFSVKKYSDKLEEICKHRKLNVTTRNHLTKVDPLNRTATFENLDSKVETTLKYDFLHITPPMASYDVIKSSKLSDPSGFVAVNKETLQHVQYKNVFAVGDCTNLPTSKTAAAIASQQNVLYYNLLSVMKDGDPDKLKYDGYTSCPFVTKFNKGILAEFGYDGKIMETFPFDQGNESTLVYIMKTEFLPFIYWRGLVRGLWNGPRKLKTFLKPFEK